MKHILLAKDFNMSFSIEFLIIILLFAYIIYLHFQVSKKKFLIKTFLKKFGKTESKLAKKDIICFLENLKNSEFSGVVTKDKMMDKKFISFLFENESEINIFIHYTAKEDVAEKILSEGFKFVNSFYKTAEYIYNDELYLIHRHYERKQYGHYVIVICISKDTYNHYSDELSKLKVKNIDVEHILTETPSYIDENSDEIYTFPKQFIKGYFNYMDETIVENPEFNYNFHSDVFDKNLKSLTNAAQGCK
ncbi:MAG: hypothetical protein KAT68_17780 [Bacteroidales bacterium]|nr:hypothetical protein [Bacteroidales bacterium]